MHHDRIISRSSYLAIVVQFAEHEAQVIEIRMILIAAETVNISRVGTNENGLILYFILEIYMKVLSNIASGNIFFIQKVILLLLFF